MKVRIQDQEIPFPLTTISGKLKLCGLSDTATSQILKDIKQTKLETEEDISERKEFLRKIGYKF